MAFLNSIKIKILIVSIALAAIPVIGEDSTSQISFSPR